jgi:GT2 family glycosyltransferase
MSAVETRRAKGIPPVDRIKPPSVLVILVVKDGLPWLRHCLISLSRQTHRRISVLAIDNGSTDGSVEVLGAALGEGRVIRLEGNARTSAGISEALRSGAAREADYALLLHDDTMLAPEAIASMVEEAERTADVGVVGPKVVDWDHPNVLRDVGQSTDRFGYAYSPLEEGEIDQGQYERVREVLFVSSCAMLVSRAAWNRIGPPDERLESRHDDLDFCWRARVAGFRVLMTPRAVARHGAQSSLHEPKGTARPSRDRYHRERAALASMLKNHGLLSLSWVLPLYVVNVLGRVATLVATRRFEDAYQVLAAWGWNVAHLPGTLRRRVQVQAVRTVRDRQVARLMAPAGVRLRRLSHSAGQLVLPSRALDGEEVPLPSDRSRTARFATSHPVAVAWSVVAVLALVAYRDLLGGSALVGGALPGFPDAPTTFFRELASGLRSTGLGGAQPASPALAMLGFGSVVALGSPLLLQKVLLLGLPAAAAIGCHRSVRALTGSAMAGVVAAACYGLSAVVLWALSEGRIPVLIFLAGLPWLSRKLAEAFDPPVGVSRGRWAVGAGLGLAILGSFYPGTFLAALLLGLGSMVVPNRSGPRPRGAASLGLALAVAGLLASPLTLVLLGAGGRGVADPAGGETFLSLARLAPGLAPGSWPMAAFLPAAGAIGFVLAAERFARPTLRLAALALAGSYLAWLAGAGHLPLAMTNPVAYVGVAAVSYALLVGYGLASILGGFTRSAFGHRQLGAVLLALVVGAGLLAQSFQVARGGWAVGGPDRLTASYRAVSGSPGGPFRVLWLGRPGAEPFAAPGGPPDATVAAGRASVRFAVRTPSGPSILDVARPSSGPGYDALSRSLGEVLSGTTRHGGALLASFGIRFVVVRPGDISTAARRELDAQVDLEPVPADDLIVFRNPKAVPLATGIRDTEWLEAAFATDPGAVSSVPVTAAVPLSGSGKELGSTNAADLDLVLLSQQFDDRWRLVAQPEGREVGPREAFGWSVGFAKPPSAAAFDVRFGGQWLRLAQLAFLAGLWLAALWITRRPVRGG